uniref:Uncharacterized protein n=1 Tax=Peronospora matthiolae TaxID=2874970 RepID=A0AAV1TUA5_9STRA
MSLCVVSESVPNTPELRRRLVDADTPTVQEEADESRKDRRHHHHHVKKVKKIAIPVPVEVPQFIPVPVSVPSTVVASSDTTAVVGTSTNVASTTVASTNVAATGAATGAIGSAGAGAATSTGPGAVTPAPTTANASPAATPAATMTSQSRATPAPTTSASSVGIPSVSQQPRGVAQPRGAGVTGDLSSRPTVGSPSNALGGGLGAPSTTAAAAGAGGFPANSGSLGEGPTSNRGGNFGGASGMGGFGGGMFGGVGGQTFSGNGMGDSFSQRMGFGQRNGSVQQLGIGAQGGNEVGRMLGQGAMMNFGQVGNNGLSRNNLPGFAGAAPGGGNAIGGRRLSRRDVHRRR